MPSCKSIAEEVLSEWSQHEVWSLDFRWLFFLLPKLAKLKHEHSKLEEKCKIVRIKNCDQLHKPTFRLWHEIAPKPSGSGGGGGGGGVVNSYML